MMLDERERGTLQAGGGVSSSGCTRIGCGGNVIVNERLFFAGARGAWASGHIGPAGHEEEAHANKIAKIECEGGGPNGDHLGDGVAVDGGHDANAYDELPGQSRCVKSLQKALVFEGSLSLVRLVGHVAKVKPKKK